MMRKLTVGLESAQKCRNVLTVNSNSSSRRPGSLLGAHPELECGTRPVSHLSASEGSLRGSQEIAGKFIAALKDYLLINGR